MAIFYNQATLTFGGATVDSNIAYGEILEVLTVTKTVLGGSYNPGDTVTYVVTLRNTGTTALTGLTVTDDLGSYETGGNTVYPLTYEEGTAELFVNGAPQGAPIVTAGPPLIFSGVTVPAGGDTVIVYEARANDTAAPGIGGEITNTVTVTGDGLTAPATADATAEVVNAPSLTITKTITPSQVVDNDRVTYTFVVANSGNAPVELSDNAVITDIFDPVLSDLTVTFNGSVWTEGTQYTYDEATGTFTTVEGNISVPAATFTQDPTTGVYTVTPGLSTLVVTGTI